MSHRLQQISAFRTVLTRRLCMWRVLFYTQLILSAISSGAIIQGGQAGIHPNLNMLSLILTALVASTQPVQRECFLLDLWKQSIELESRIHRDTGVEFLESIDNDICLLRSSMCDPLKKR